MASKIFTPITVAATANGVTNATTVSSARFVLLQNSSAVSADVLVTLREEGGFTDATCDYDDDPTITHDANANIVAGLYVSGTGIPAGAYIDSITDSTHFELSASTTGGAVTNGTLTFKAVVGSFYINGDSSAVIKKATTDKIFAADATVYFTGVTITNI